MKLEIGNPYGQVWKLEIQEKAKFLPSTRDQFLHLELIKCNNYKNINT